MQNQDSRSLEKGDQAGPEGQKDLEKEPERGRLIELEQGGRQERARNYYLQKGESGAERNL
ncbi:MAG: hypothetical protein ACRC5V_00790 [Aeromonas sp.]